MVYNKQEVYEVQKLERHLWSRYFLELLTQGADGDELPLRRIISMPERARFEIFRQRKFFFIIGVDGRSNQPNKPSYFGDAPGVGQILNDFIMWAKDGGVG